MRVSELALVKSEEARDSLKVVEGKFPGMRGWEVLHAKEGEWGRIVAEKWFQVDVYNGGRCYLKTNDEGEVLEGHIFAREVKGLPEKVKLYTELKELQGVGARLEVKSFGDLYTSLVYFEGFGGNQHLISLHLYSELLEAECLLKWVKEKAFGKILEAVKSASDPSYLELLLLDKGLRSVNGDGWLSVLLRHIEVEGKYSEEERRVLRSVVYELIEQMPKRAFWGGSFPYDGVNYKSLPIGIAKERGLDWVVERLLVSKRTGYLEDAKLMKLTEG